ncbi:RNA-directed DNA polymerase [Ascochyta rabiei]|uniref:RNA-directed DNA polymerase n=1 Tax=Didymella rabiei TaxID=5454 RepID=UPI0022066C47|nr:RNA-directed DNA polymerase [Ascochyta rabiei]UPX18047.1 RNA-directed DNA polymerase [Ascochyta rabiei]
MKRKCTSHAAGSRKKAHLVDQSASATPTAIQQPVLQHFYPRLLTLRHYLLSQLPNSSKNRRRKLAELGLAAATKTAAASTCDPDYELGQLLDSTVIGQQSMAKTDNQQQITTERNKDIEAFIQQLSPAITGGTFKPGYLLQSEIVDIVIWRLFKRSSSHKIRHLICHGFERSGSTYRQNALDRDNSSSIPGLVARYPNNYVRTLKGPLWCRLQAVLGEGGDRIMMDMLMDCAIFRPVDGTFSNYHQLSGPPIFDLKPCVPLKEPAAEPLSMNPRSRQPSDSASDYRTLCKIAFVRNRMLYAKPALNGKGGITFGMRHIHVLNRFSRREDKQQVIQIMRYIFPRQFGLHNVFTSKVDARETAMPLKDYTLREKEIHQGMCRDLGDKIHNPNEVAKWKLRVPKRLRGDVVLMIEKLRILNQRCSYAEMLRHYCPVEALPLSSNPVWRKSHLHLKYATTESTGVASRRKNHAIAQADEQSNEEACFTDMACPTANVSAFCRAIVSKVIPKRFWGDKDIKRTIMHYIDQFVSLRKFETLTLHQVTQKLPITSLAWLRLPGQDETAKLARSDFEKRKEILQEFVYWLFDSFLIPLIRSNFYVTESNAHRNRLFYFRHDVWRMLAEPSLSTLRLKMFEEMPTERANKLLAVRPLGFSKIRLLPKKQGIRMIMNLKRKLQVTRYGAMTLQKSINAVMAPVFHAITYEKTLQPEKFGSSLFSVGDMFPKLEAFKKWLQEQGLSGRPLYFAKVDVLSCFDTIPQQRLLSMMDSLVPAQAYQTGKHVEISPMGALQRLDGQHVSPAPLKRWVSHTVAANDTQSFSQLVQNKLVGSKSNTIFVDANLQQQETKANLMHLLGEHVERNLVKIGKRFYRQKRGIPQGSILSSILCNYFYAELERDVLGFALSSDCLLLRLLDDFLLITVNRQHAERFVRVMHRGHADYGVEVKPSKSMANFDVTTEDGTRLPKCSPATDFLYCGVCIDTTTLEVRKNSERYTRTDVGDSLTTELSKVPGQTFHRKALNGFKIQLKAMFIDTALNSVSTVLSNLHQSFHEAAVRCLEYVRVLAKVRTTCSSLLIRTVDSIIALAFVMVQRRARSRSDRSVVHVQSVISRRQLQWLACKAFHTVFQRAQTKHSALLREMLEAAASAWQRR